MVSVTKPRNSSDEHASAFVVRRVDDAVPRTALDPIRSEKSYLNVGKVSAPRRILLSAYACEPNRGSEPGIGWNWAIELQRQGRDIVVLTRENNRVEIEKYFTDAPSTPRPLFVYYDLPRPFLYLKRLGILPLQLYYWLWQIFCVGTARKAVAAHQIELVWHLTFGAIRLPSLLWVLGKPFVFGPGGGGEFAPIAMRGDYPIGGHIRDLFRDALNLLSRVDPLLRAMFANAALILAKTHQSARLVPRRWHDKTEVYLEIGTTQNQKLDVRTPQGRVLYAGGFLYLKGITIAVRAFAAFIRAGGSGRFTLVGRGAEEQRARALARRLGVNHLIDWISWVDRKTLDRIYASHDVFLFPSLHDSSGNVVVEAMSHALPVICFDLGGPAEVVTPDSGIVVATNGRVPETAAEAMAAALKKLLDDPHEFRRLSAGALQRARDFSWEARATGALAKVDAAYAERVSQSAQNA